MANVQRRVRRRALAEINVVPYIDVMLVLLVIFIISAPLLTQGVNVELPKAASAPLQSDTQEPLVVSVDRAGKYYLNVGDHPDQVIDPQSLVNKVAAVMRHKPGTPVMVRGDKKVDYGAVVTVMALLQRAGAPSVGLVSESPDVVPSR